MNIKLEWMDMFADTGTATLDAHFIEYGEEFFSLYKLLSESAPILFTLTKTQQKEFNSYFASVQKEYNSLFGADIIASVRRLGVITYRIAMILSSLRLMEIVELPQQIVCSDADFQTAIHLSKTLIQHTARVFDFFPEKHTNLETQKTLKEKFFDSLPESFSRVEYLQKAKELGVPERTADKQIKSFCAKGILVNVQHGRYVKV